MVTKSVDKKVIVKEILDKYLEANGRRKTPERYAILDVAYGYAGHFSLRELGDELDKRNFFVSRATLYNAIRLLTGLHLVKRHHIMGETRYEACYDNENRCHQICTVCGKVTDSKPAGTMKSMVDVKFNRFHGECFSIYIYGVCSACQARINRQNASKARKKKILR